YLANRIQDKIHQIEQQRIPTGTIDITYFRDDIEHMSSLTTKDAIDIVTDITDKVVIIIDDVLYTGRTVRASLDAILLNARPIKIGLAALVDRGHRELPIRADFVGKNIPTSKEETVSVYLEEMDQRNAVIIK
ncbi:bifunctional pyr operon transcriptional regulator/uracil phosphoribosyltransferase PyrR, partial [Escherichia coli]|nr:bifunctional pyr operon transcriptional regulator/uracil phosphoribosyltransferase PyrR [Escherichia coli]